MEREIDVWGPVSRGDLSAVSAWLKEHVHQYGSLFEPAEIVRRACGTFDPAVYTTYLDKKYRELYRLPASSAM
jgi:carboxypeptidase Taq